MIVSQPRLTFMKMDETEITCSPGKDLYAELVSWFSQSAERNAPEFQPGDRVRIVMERIPYKQAGTIGAPVIKVR
jgi:hypothetical protein